MGSMRTVAQMISQAGQSRRQYQWMVLSRIVAAFGGGYVFSVAATVALTYLLPLPRRESLMAATILSYVLYLVAILWAFATRSATRAWVGMTMGSGVLAVVAWVAMVARGVTP